MCEKEGKSRNIYGLFEGCYLEIHLDILLNTAGQLVHTLSFELGTISWSRDAHESRKLDFSTFLQNDRGLSDKYSFLLSLTKWDIDKN